MLLEIDQVHMIVQIDMIPEIDMTLGIDMILEVHIVLEIGIILERDTILEKGTQTNVEILNLLIGMVKGAALVEVRVHPLEILLEVQILLLREAITDVDLF